MQVHKCVQMCVSACVCMWRAEVKKIIHYLFFFFLNTRGNLGPCTCRAFYLSDPLSLQMHLIQSKGLLFFYIHTDLTVSEPPKWLWWQFWFTWKCFFNGQTHMVAVTTFMSVSMVHFTDGLGCCPLRVGWTLRLFRAELQKPLNFSWALSCYTPVDSGLTSQPTVWISGLPAGVSITCEFIWQTESQLLGDLLNWDLWLLCIWRLRGHRKCTECTLHLARILSFSMH